MYLGIILYFLIKHIFSLIAFFKSYMFFESNIWHKSIDQILKYIMQMLRGNISLNPKISLSNLDKS
jgi:hypothetical protein